MLAILLCSRSRRVSRNLGFTLIELLVVVAIIGVLAGLLLPAFSNVKNSSIQSKCISNLRQIGVAMNLYANDHEGLYPYTFGDPMAGSDMWTDWPYRLGPYLTKNGNAGREDATDVLSCPAKLASTKSGSNGVATYGVNSYMVSGYSSWVAGWPWCFSKVRVPRPSQIILVGDMEPVNMEVLATSDKQTSFGKQSYGMGFRHGSTNSSNKEGRELANVVFCDGDAESLKYNQLLLNPPDLANKPAGEKSRWKWW